MQWMGHLKTINKHKFTVMKLCFRCGLYKQGLLHDLSKYSWVELRTGFKYYKGTYSPNSAERNEKGYSEAWLHHKGRNKHHFEYWIDCVKGEWVGCKMPLKYVIEMFCDRVAASMTYKGKDFDCSSPMEYFNSHKHEYYLMHPETYALIEGLLLYLQEHGLDAAIDYIKKEILPKGTY